MKPHTIAHAAVLALPRTLTVALVLALGGCASWFDFLNAPPMAGPRGVASTMPAQNTTQLTARAERERENLPQPTPMSDPQTYSNLGTVPPKPVLPTPAEIAGQIAGLAGEQQQGAAAIAAQADAPEPETLPKPGEAQATGQDAGRPRRPVGTPPASPVDQSAVPIIPVPQAPFLSGAAPLEGEESEVFSADQQAFLPQSQTIEQTDLRPDLQP